MKKSQLFIQLGIILVIVIVANAISDKLYFRLDFTEDSRYTLSEATKDILDELDDVITIKAYFSENLPPQLMSTRRDFEDFLTEYESRSGGNVIFEFINPNESEEMEGEAQQNGISPLIIGVNEGDKVVQLRAYMGASLQRGNQTEVIPQIQPGAAMEFSLTTSIKKLAVAEKPKVGLLSGHGEPTLQEVGQLAQQLLVLYDVQPVDLSQTMEIGPDFKSLIWVNPTDSISRTDFANLDGYLSRGGRILIAYNTVEGDMQQALLRKKNAIGIRDWLSGKGIQLGDRFVVDAQCSQIQVQQQRGFMRMVSSVQFPYFPIVNSFEDHPVAAGLEQIGLPFTNSITYNSPDSTANFIPLLKSSQQSGFVEGPTYIDIEKKWSESDFTEGSQVLAAAIDNVAGAGSKLVIISNGQFIINQNQQAVAADNVNLASNAVDWLSDDTGLIQLRTKAVTSRPLELIEDGERNLLKYGNVFAPILLLLVYGFIRRHHNSRKRQAWMQGNY